MKIETTPMDDLWIGMVTVALLYMVMKTVSALEKMSQKADAFVNHIGAEVESAGNKLSKEARWILQSLERSSLGYKETLLSQVQSVELQCYRSKSGIAFGLGPRTQKKKKRSHATAAAAAAAALTEAGENENRDSQHRSPQHHSTVAIYKCVDRILKSKHWCKWPLSLVLNKDQQRQQRHDQQQHQQQCQEQGGSRHHHCGHHLEAAVESTTTALAVH